MTIVRIALKGAIVAKLKRAFQQADAKRRSSELLATWTVGFADGSLRVEIRSNEHPPPHFHVLYSNEDASFAIEDCRRLPNVFGLERYEVEIRNWWRVNQHKLAVIWNKSRPTDCPVGRIPVPPPPPRKIKKKKRKKQQVQVG